MSSVAESRGLIVSWVFRSISWILGAGPGLFHSAFSGAMLLKSMTLKKFTQVLLNVNY